LITHQGLGVESEDGLEIVVGERSTG